MERNFVYGTQYLRGTTPARADWARDMAEMRKLNFNTIRAWLVWGCLEPRENEIDLESIGYFLDCAKANNLSVIFLFHLHGAPEWAIRKYPEYRYVNERGDDFEPSARSNTPSGGWPGLCPDHPEVQQLEERFIATIVKTFGNRPEVRGWEPMNEPHMWHDMEKIPGGVYCYCPATREAFREWLITRYGSLERLEAAWGRRFDDWKSVRPPTWKFGFSDWADWRTYIAENIAAQVLRRCQIIRRHTTQTIIAHAWGGGCVSCSSLGYMAFDDWKNAAAVDIWGCSAFPSSPSNLSMIGLSMDSTRSAANGKEFWQAELGTGDYLGGLERTWRPAPQVYASWCFEALAHGTDGLMFWQFRKEKSGSEMGCYGLTHYDGTPTEIGREAGKIGAVLQEHADLLHQARSPKAEVAILFSYQSHMVVWAQYRQGNLYTDSLHGYYHALWQAGITVDILHEEFLTPEKLAGYKLIILPFPVALSGGCGELLAEYAKNGGSLIADPGLCLFDADKELSSNVPGQGLDTIFGATEDNIRTMKNSNSEVTWNDQVYRLESSHFMATWNAAPTTTVLAATPDGQPLMTDNTVYGGHLILAGFNLGICNAPKMYAAIDFSVSDGADGNQDATALILALAEKAGVLPPLEVPPGLRAVYQPVDSGRALLTVLNLLPHPIMGNIAPRRGAWRQARELYPDNGEVTINGALSLEVEPWGCRVYEVKA